MGSVEVSEGRSGRIGMEGGLWGAGGLEGGEVNESARRRGNAFPGKAPVGGNVGGGGRGSSGGGGGGAGGEGARCCGERHGGVGVIERYLLLPPLYQGAETEIANNQTKLAESKNGKKIRGEDEEKAGHESNVPIEL